MKNNRRSQTSDVCCSQRRRSHYDKEMDLAFTLIFHNIKRLQDGHLSKSAPTLSVEQPDESKSGINPTNTLHVPLARERSSSVPSLRLPESMQTHTGASNLTRPKSRSFCSDATSPRQKRKVRFSDDYATTNEHVIQRSALAKRSWTDLPPNPLIVVTKES